jgi:hypothetical protein
LINFYQLKRESIRLRQQQELEDLWSIHLHQVYAYRTWLLMSKFDVAWK